MNTTPIPACGTVQAYWRHQRLREPTDQACRDARRAHRTDHDPEIPSDGLTLDTPHGPVDLVAVERVTHSHPIPVTRADTRHAVSLLTGYGYEPMRALAEGLGISLDAVQRAYARHQQQKAHTP